MKKLQWKKIALLGLLCLIMALCAACGGKDGNVATDTGNNESDKIPVILNNAEYLLYQNVFYNGYGSQYNLKSVEKQGVFTSIYDAYNNRERYYVWGYLDQTMCCDWQWELAVTDPSNLPPRGSLIKVKGVFVGSDDALDRYWIMNPDIQVVTKYTGPSTEIDMLTMSDTLERVQLINVVNKSAVFEGKQFSLYGRIYSTGTVQDPYYDGSWQVPYTITNDEYKVPAIGTTVNMRGTIVEGTFQVSSIEIRE